MGKIYKKLKATVFIVALMLTAGTVFAQYVSVQSGLASDPATWGGTVQADVPTVFGGTGTNDDIIISSGDTILFDENYEVTNKTIFTLQASAAFICRNFSAKGDAIINGLLISFGQVKTNGGAISGTDGVIYAISLGGGTTIGGTITVYDVFETWTGTADNVWTNTANWSGGALPLATERVLIDPTAVNMPSISTSENIRTLLLSPGQSLTVESTGTLQIDSFLVNNGTVNIQSDASGTGNLFVGKPYEGSGYVNVQRYIADSAWYMISSPVAGEILYNIGLDYAVSKPNTFALAPYVESTDSWAYVDSSDHSTEFGVGAGYSILVKSGNLTMTFQGDSIHTTPKTVTLDSSSSGYGWNAIGNPYTTSISIDSFLTQNGTAISDAWSGVYIWDHTLSPADYDVVSTGSVAVGQGFIVRASAPGTVNFDPSQQVIGPTVPFKSSTFGEPGLKLTVQSMDLKNYTRINFTKTAGDGLDKFQDLGKLKGNRSIALSTKLVDASSDIDFAVQALANKDFEKLTIPVGLDLPGGGETVFKLEMTNFPEDARVYLHDKLTGGKIELSLKNAEYQVELPAMNGEDRFELVVENFKSGQIATGINEEVNEVLNIYSGKGKIIISGQVSRKAQFSVYGIDGRMMVKKMASNLSRNEIDASAFPDGIYIVRVEDAGLLQTNKVIIKK